MQIRNPHTPPFIIDSPEKDLELIVIIPVFNEDDLIGSLDSLYQCDPIDGSVEVIALINNSISETIEIKEKNTITYQKAKQWAEKYSTTKKKFHIHYFSELPPKHAGVGLARKIAMDEAARRFVSIEKLDGIIQCYDADCRCDPNLLQEVIKGFEKKQSSSLGIYYEHPIEGIQYPQEIYDAIVSYELHLRYYDNIQKHIGLPFAFQTIGSSMAVRTKDYIRQGGMNKRKAGEDFYFLQKFITIDQHSEITTTRVIPSPRKSDRVPFGTGKAVNDIIEKENHLFMSYNPLAFDDLKTLMNDIDLLYNSKHIKTDLSHWPKSLRSFFIGKEDMESAINEIKSNTSNFELFRKRFFKWFNAFKLMKFLHYCRDENIIPDIPIIDAAHQFIEQYLNSPIKKEEKELLLFLRSLDKKRQ